MNKDYILVDYQVLIDFIDKNNDIKSILRYLIFNDYKEIYTEKEIKESVFQYIVNQNTNLTEFVKQLYYKDLYKSLYEYCLKDIDSSASFDKHVEVAINTYNYQKKLNTLLNVSSNDFDRFLIGCVVGEMKNKLHSYTLNYLEKEFIDCLVMNLRTNTLNDIAENIKNKKLEKKLI